MNNDRRHHDGSGKTGENDRRLAFSFPPPTRYSVVTIRIAMAIAFPIHMWRVWATLRKIKGSDGTGSETPPLRAQRILYFVLPKKEREYLVGDLEEEFRTVILPKFGAKAAQRWYWWQAVRSVGPFLLAGLKKLVRIGVLLRITDWISKIGS